MKNICFILISLCISLSSFAQTDAQHLKFKGVPIDGTLAAYVSKMKAAGFSDLGIKDGTAVLQGDFAGFKGCIIGVSTLKTTNVVNTIGVIFPECDNWSKLENNYQTLKEMLIQKYGEPADCVEKFQSYSQPNDDGLRLTFCEWTNVHITQLLKHPMGIFNYHWNIKIDVALQNYSIGIKSTPIKLKHKQWMICNIKRGAPVAGAPPSS